MKHECNNTKKKSVHVHNYKMVDDCCEMLLQTDLVCIARILSFSENSSPLVLYG